MFDVLLIFIFATFYSILKQCVDCSVLACKSFGDIGGDERIILKHIFKIQCEDVGWI